jgi:hypothetical protein
MGSVGDDTGQIDDGEALGHRSPHLFHCGQGMEKKGTHARAEDGLAVLF